MKKPIGIALIGYGGIGRVHALAYRNLPFHYQLPAENIRIVGVATNHADTARHAAAEIGCQVWSADYRELLLRDDVDVVDCMVPNDRHQEVVIAAAAAGKHIYCEKPLSHTLESARQMVAAVENAGVKSQMTFNFRFFPAITRAHQLIKEGFLGRVFSFRGHYHRASYIDAAKPISWRLQQQHAGGGALFDLGSHLLDIIRYLLGDCATVAATLETLIAQRPVTAGATEQAPVDVDDLAQLRLRMVNGSLGQIEASRMGTGATNDLQFSIYGDRGAIRFDAANPSWLEVYDMRDRGTPLGGMRGFRRLQTVQRYEAQRVPDWTMPPGFVRAHAECQHRFLTAVANDSAPSPNFTDGLAIQQIMQAARQSSEEEGRWVAIDG